MNEMWNGFWLESFVFEGQEACVVFPREGTANGRLALKTVYWDAVGLSNILDSDLGGR